MCSCEHVVLSLNGKNMESTTVQPTSRDGTWHVRWVFLIGLAQIKPVAAGQMKVAIHKWKTKRSTKSCLKDSNRLPFPGARLLIRTAQYAFPRLWVRAPTHEKLHVPGAEAYGLSNVSSRVQNGGTVHARYGVRSQSVAMVQINIMTMKCGGLQGASASVGDDCSSCKILSTSWNPQRSQKKAVTA